MANFIYTFKLFTNFHIKVSYFGSSFQSNSESELEYSPDHIYHLISPFSLPTLFIDIFAPHNDQVCQRIVISSAGSSAFAGDFGLGVLEILQCWLLCALYLSVQDVLLGVLSIDSLQITVLVLFYIFTNGAIWFPSTFSFCLLWGHSGMGDW